MTQTVDTGSPLKSTEKRPQAANDTPPPEEKCSRHKATQPLPQPQPQAAAPPKRQPKKPVRRKATRPLVQQCQELLAQPVPQDFVDFAGVESLAAQRTGGEGKGAVRLKTTRFVKPCALRREQAAQLPASR